MKSWNQDTAKIGYPVQITNAGDFTVKPDWTLGPRKLDDYELVYFPTGSLTSYEVKGRSFPLAYPAYILTPPNEEHSYRFDRDQPTRHLFIHFMIDPSIQDRFATLQSEGSLVLPASEITIIPSMIKHILSLSSSKPLHWEERCNTFLYSLLGEIQSLTADQKTQRNESGIPYQIKKSLEYIFQNLNNPSLTVSQIAEFLEWSHAHFTRQFVKHVGISPQEKILNGRIEQACQLLIQEQWNVKQISYIVGFSDEHYFSRAFMKVKGITATKFREKYANPMNLHLAPVDSSQTAYPRNHYFVWSNER